MNPKDNARYKTLMNKVFERLEDRYSEYLNDIEVKNKLINDVYLAYENTGDDQIDIILLKKETEKLIKQTPVPSNLKI